MINNIILKQFRRELPPPGKTGLDWYLFLWFLTKSPNKKFLEIGIGAGGSLISMCSASDDVTAIDDWSYNWDKSTIEHYLSSLNKSCKFIDRDSTQIDPKDLEQYDFIHLDANKERSKVHKDLELCDSICKGVICVDDYMNSLYPDVTWAVDNFIKDNPQWQRQFIGNHQVFLSRDPIDISDLLDKLPTLTGNLMSIPDFDPIKLRDTQYLVFGSISEELKEFIDHGDMKHAWHNNAWPNNP